MPTYEFRCTQCGWEQAVVRRIKDRNRKPKCPSCSAGGPVERILTVPHAQGWNDREIFPNLHKLRDIGEIAGGMRFPDRDAYEKHLKENGIVELGGPKCGDRPRKIFHYGKKDTQPVPPRGAW